MLRNHGVLVTAGTLAEGFERLYFLERACQAQVLAALHGRRPWHLLPDALVRATAAQLRSGDTVGGEPRVQLHFSALKRLLERGADADYAS